MNKLHPIMRTLKQSRKAQLLASILLSAILVLAGWYILPDEVADYLFTPGFLLTVRFFSAGVHAGPSLTVAIIAASIILYAVAIYAALRLLGRRRPEH